MGDIKVDVMTGCSMEPNFLRKLTDKCGNTHTKLGKLQASS